MLKVDYEHLRQSRQGIWIALDLFMLFMLIINLSLIIIDALFDTAAMQFLTRNYTPWLHEPLVLMHENFLLVDLAFVSLFISEFMLRWLVAIKEKTFERWYFFPFLHWYDLLGCIPLGSTRLLRFLRVFSIIYRLHKYKIIDVTSTRLFTFFAFYYNVFLEELSDRVVVKVISGIQEDLRHDSEIGRRIAEKIVEPRLPVLAETWSHMVTQLSGNMRSNPDNPLVAKLRRSLTDAMQSHVNFRRVNAIPFIGSNITGRLEDTIADIVVSTIANLLEDLEIPDNIDGVKSSFEQLNLRSGGALMQLDDQVIELIVDILELSKEQVAVQSWKRELRAAQNTSPEDKGAKDI
ncbi:hypothetical protein ONV78_08835 [Hahella sp. CR1]|uniref:hypothetical protein n=1 Tax=Hahella sp. CR1 TaxID=2992807 RepID=UPI002443486E|nr:hypothetical protein [Hahella sp. CR1]MDG9667834.1 hypothetical protein [Hahella sp. CR1]